MTPRDITADDVHRFRGLDPRLVTYAADNETVSPVQALVTTDDAEGFAKVVRVPWVLDEIDLAHLARGGTLWLACMDALPAHYLSVEPPATIDT